MLLAKAQPDQLKYCSVLFTSWVIVYWLISVICRSWHHVAKWVTRCSPSKSGQVSKTVTNELVLGLVTFIDLFAAEQYENCVQWWLDITDW